ncbi:MAG: hypothetical protein ACKV2T_34615 [Kofleriaceae bacterium]
MQPTRLAIHRGVAAFLAVAFVFATRPVTASPGDIFSIPAPALGSDPPKAAELSSGDATVSTQTGAMQYSYRVSLPPGRSGMAPQLALSYSSQGPTFGGVAAGWMSIPMISEDRSRGRLESRSTDFHDNRKDGHRGKRDELDQKAKDREQRKEDAESDGEPMPPKPKMPRRE